jgi:hypothetical protein
MMNVTLFNCHNEKCYSANCHYYECHSLSVIMTNAIKITIAMSKVTLLKARYDDWYSANCPYAESHSFLRVIIKYDSLLTVVMLNVILLNVVAANKQVISEVSTRCFYLFHKYEGVWGGGRAGGNGGMVGDSEAQGKSEIKIYE